MSGFADLQSNLRRYGNPATASLVAVLAGAFLVSFFTSGQVAAFLAFDPSAVVQRPWTLLTYPFANTMAGFINVIFSGLWLWSIGGSLERDLGSASFFLFWLALTLFGSIAILLGVAVLHMRQFALFGDLLPLAAVTVGWAVRNPRQMLTFMFVLPITGIWLGFIAAGLAIFNTGAEAGNPAMGAFACIPLLAAYVFASDRIPGLPYGKGYASRTAWKPSERNDRYFDEVRKREKEREERERLRKLFEGSLKDDPEDDRGAGS